MNYIKKIDAKGHPYLAVSLSDYMLMNDHVLNKGMAFSEQERHTFHLDGLLPPHDATLDEQRKRSYEAFCSKPSELEKYIYLRDLQDSNETLFYNLLTSYVTEMLPIVYTPVVGAGCQRFSELYRRPRGLFIAYPHQKKIEHILSNPRFDTVKVIVVSDGERILGLGDQGAGGMGIPIGKLALYSACAGVHPAETLPILLDTGTNNKQLLDDPLYVGWKHERIRGKDYNDFIDAFVMAVKKRFPHILLQWEDFAQQNANPILLKYRNQLCTFNDDIQGTAAIATATLLSSLHVTRSSLSEQRIVIFGGGSAGCGIGNLIIQAMMDDGLTEIQARSKLFIIDRNGLLIHDTVGILPFQEAFGQRRENLAQWTYANADNISLMEVISNSHPTVLIGVSGQKGAFNEAIVKEMASHVSTPVILPLSNPTDYSEATPDDLMTWTNGKVIIGTGSPFPPVLRHGISTRIDQTNNAYIFPGIGLGLIAVQATRVTDKMFMIAAKALASCSPTIDDPNANLLPSLNDIRKVSLVIGLAVAKEAVASGFASPHTTEQIEEKVRLHVWEPIYLPYRKG